MAAKNPEKLKDLQAIFDAEAKKYNGSARLEFRERAMAGIRPSLTRGRSVFTYQAGAMRIAEVSMPDVKNKSYRVTADVEISEGGE